MYEGPAGDLAPGPKHATISPEVPTVMLSVPECAPGPLSRSTSLQGIARRDAMDTAEIRALVQELDYHTELSRKQLQELGERLQAARGGASHEASPATTPPAPANDASLLDVLTEFELPHEPEALRRVLSKELRLPKAALAPSEPDLQDATPSSSSFSARGGRRPSDGPAAGDRLRMAVRCQMSHFLKDSRNRVKVLILWRHEAASLQAVQQCGSVLGGGQGDKWYEKLYMASEAMLSNLLDENDSPLREVVFDLVSFEANRAAWGTPKDEHAARPPQVEAMRRVFRCLADAVLSVRTRPGPGQPAERFEKSQWVDCLSRLSAQFERALEETWPRLWPGVYVQADGRSEDGVAQTPLLALQNTLQQSSGNAWILCKATAAIVDSAEALNGESRGDPQDFWVAYLRQAIRVSKGFLQLSREMTVLTGLWMSRQGTEEQEDLSYAVHRQEYRRVRHAFAQLLGKQSLQILDAWGIRISQDLPKYAKFLEERQDKLISKKMLVAVIEWWRTSHSGKLRATCIDLVSLRFDDEQEELDLELDDVQAALPIFEEVILETLHRELAVRSGHDLSAADEPRVRDILARLTHEIGRHIEGEWHIAETARSAAHDVLPLPQLFQVPNWRPSAPFDFGASKTAFLGSEISSRFVVTRYVNRGAMGRVWVVEDRLNPSEFPLCLKTFYCECECEEMSNLTVREFKRCVLEELSQVERWMTSRTRLAVSRHLVHVVRVFRDAPVVRTSNGVRVEGVINGILMEFCDRGELTYYLWDDKAHKPRAFDEAVAQYLFAQLAELVVELFAPQQAASRAEQCFSFDAAEDAGTSSNMLCPPAMSIERDTSMGAMSLQSLDSSSCRDGPEGLESITLSQQKPIQYFHNDVKTENLVLSGTTLKLIDFQSLTPLRRSRFSRLPQLEHATLEYQHRHPAALSEATGARAEGVVLWACGVILVRLLAAELGGDWVFRHRGLGSQEALEQQLPPDHCLLKVDESGPRNLLDEIFSPEATPSIVDVLSHPWVRGARRSWQAGKASQVVQMALEELRPQGCDPRKDLVAWIPLTGCVMVEGRAPPVEDIETIIQLAIGFSGGHFRQDGVRRRCRRGSVAGELEAAEDFHEWHIITCDTAAEEENADLRMPSPAVGVRRTITPSSPTGGGAKRGMWQELRTRLVLDRFCVQVLSKEDLGEDEPTGVWWLRVKWLPAMVAGKKDTLGGLTTGRRRIDSRLGLVECGGFVLLQQLLLEGRNEVAQRLERAKQEVRRPAIPGGLPLLPVSAR